MVGLAAWKVRRRGSASMALAERRVAPRSRTLASRPCSAAWSVTGPRRVVVPSSLRVSVKSNQVDQCSSRCPAMRSS